MIPYVYVIFRVQTEEGGAEESDSEQSDEYQPSDMSDEVGSEDDSDEDYSSLAEDESESGENKRYQQPSSRTVLS